MFLSTISNSGNGICYKTIHNTLQDHLLLWKYLYFIISSYYQRKRVYCKYWVIATFTFYLLGKLHNIGTITQYNIKFYCSFLESSFFTKMQSGNIKFRPILLIYITKIFIYFDLIQCSMKIYYHIFYFSEKSLCVNLNLKKYFYTWSVLDTYCWHYIWNWPKESVSLGDINTSMNEITNIVILASLSYIGL